ncbi:MAG: hypothetical protein K8J08_22920 [Thermoanaerobaculia bacterium]|nr:hypothetical protein [Thermoanaerobaculia bacterium]
MRRKLTSFLFAAATLATLSTLPALAGSIYVPIEPTAPGDQTFVTISNPSGDQVALTYYLINPFEDGTVRPEELPIRYINPGESIVLRNSLPLGERGILEITSSATLPVTARLGKTWDTPSSVTGSSVPVISSTNSGIAGNNLYLQGLQRDADGAVMTNFRMVNLGTSEATCNVTLNTIDGDVLGGFFVFPGRQPLSVTTFDDALSALSTTQDLGDIRARVSCDRTFYTYFVVHEPQSEQSVFVGPAIDTDSALGIFDGNLPCDPNGFCFEHAGVFHVPTSNNKVKRLEFPTPPGDYHKVHVRMEVKLGGWQNPSSGLHSIFWLALDRNRNLIGYLNLKGPNANSILFRHGFGQAQEDKAKVTVPAIFQPGQTYFFDYLYDTNINLIQLIVVDVATGQEVAQILHSPDTNKIKVTNSDIVLMDFGFPGVNPNEPPTYGWSYQNLWIEIAL